MRRRDDSTDELVKETPPHETDAELHDPHGTVDLVSHAAASSNEVNLNVFLGLLIPSTVVGMSGAIMLQASNVYLSRAVGHYNDDLFRRLDAASGGRTALPGRHLGLSWTRSF